MLINRRIVGPGAGGRMRQVAGGVGCTLAVCLALSAAAQVTPGVPPGRNPALTPRPAGQPASPAITQPGNPTANPPDARPGAERAGEKGLEHLPTPEPGEDEVTLSAFSEPVELTALVEYVTTTLNINSSTKGQLTGTITFNAPVKIKKIQLLPLLDALLAQYNFTITRDPTGFYMVHPISDVQVNLDGQEATTRVFPVPNVKPSFLKAAIEAQMGGGGGAAANPGTPPTPGARGIAYVDELGVIVATDSVRRLASIESLIGSLLDQYAKYRFIRRELEYVSAPVARERALALLGANVGSGGAQNPGQPNIDPNTGQPIQGQPSAGASKAESLPERLSVDPTGNALVFRGTPDEEIVLDQVLEVIDVPNNLEPKSYEVGSSAKQIAEIAKVRGLGEVQLIEKPAENDPNRPVFYNYYDPGQNQQRQTKSVSGGPTMVVDEASGKITYYATPRQHDELTKLIKEINPSEERVVIRAYKLKHSDADKVSQIILGLIENQSLPNDAGSSPLLDTGGGFSSSTTYSARGRRTTYYNPSTGQPDGELSLAGGPDVFVLPDKANNQVLVKAPIKQQPEFARLIEKIDLRRPQVFLEAKIVAVTASDEFRLAFETQLINAGGAGGVLNTNFGLSGFPTGGTLDTRKNVATGLTGLTAALIKSDQIPIALTALARDVDTRILSSPQLLVADNEEAEIASIDQQPTQTTTLGSSDNTGSRDVSSYEYVDAGTKLTVKPQISEGGYLRLKYDIELSSFSGTGSAGVPPPKQKNNVKSDSVTVPTDMTVVVGGVVVSTNGRTVVKVPLLGDIPILGALFSDDNRTDRKTTLYVFITPRIMRDDLFDDLRLLTEGPQAKSKLEADVPALGPSSIDILDVPAPEPTPALSPARDSTPSKEAKDTKDKKDTSSGVVKIR
ncbi:MAG: hypothetical protein JNL50_12830 [Phycisphaerae bacterium]|nr:hypothetical protein [Phycisphaerae bacterium]